MTARESRSATTHNLDSILLQLKWDSGLYPYFDLTKCHLLLNTFFLTINLPGQNRYLLGKWPRRWASPWKSGPGDQWFGPRRWETKDNGEGSSLPDGGPGVCVYDSMFIHWHLLCCVRQAPTHHPLLPWNDHYRPLPTHPLPPVLPAELPPEPLRPGHHDPVRQDEEFLVLKPSQRSASYSLVSQLEDLKQVSPVRVVSEVNQTGDEASSSSIFI